MFAGFSWGQPVLTVLIFFWKVVLGLNYFLVCTFFAVRLLAYKCSLLPTLHFLWPSFLFSFASAADPLIRGGPHPQLLDPYDLRFCSVSYLNYEVKEDPSSSCRLGTGFCGGVFPFFLTHKMFHINIYTTQKYHQETNSGKKGYFVATPTLHAVSFGLSIQARRMVATLNIHKNQHKNSLQIKKLKQQGQKNVCLMFRRVDMRCAISQLLFNRYSPISL